MPVALTAEQVASVITDEDSGAPEISNIIARLRTDLEEAAILLEDLSRHQDADVRFWVAWAARNVLGTSGVPIILRLAQDRDPDVRDGAVQELVELDPEAARSLFPALRRQLASTDIYEPVFAMWTLAELNDRESLPLIRAVADAPEGEYPFHQKTARVICMLMENPREIVERIRSHDHELMQWLTMAARKLRTDEAHAALEECAQSAPDRGCRQMCEGALAFWNSKD